MFTSQLKLLNISCHAPIEVHHGKDKQCIAPRDPFHEWNPRPQCHNRGGNEKKDESASGGKHKITISQHNDYTCPPTQLCLGDASQWRAVPGKSLLCL